MSTDNVTSTAQAIYPAKPVVPRHGAYLLVAGTGPLRRFDHFTEDGKVRLLGDIHPVLIEEAEALVPAHYGVIYERAIIMPNHDMSTPIVAITQWRSLNPIIRVQGSQSVSAYPANSIAGLAPVLDPATESLEDKVERLERERALLEAGLQQRMVAEGVARGWCSEFDGILDSTGLAPRTDKRTIVGTMRFVIDSPTGGVSLEDIKRLPQNHIGWDKITVSEIGMTETVTTALLS